MNLASAIISLRRAKREIDEALQSLGIIENSESRFKMTCHNLRSWGYHGEVDIIEAHVRELEKPK